MERLRRQPKDKKKILVVCGEGVATAQLLASRIRAELPNIDIVQVLSLQELRRYKISKNAIDAILATIPLNIDDVPVIIVNPFLRAEDISRLNEALELAGTAAIKETTPLNPDENDSLSDLITAATIRLQVNARSWMEVVDKAGASLINAKAIEPAYVEAMKQTLVKHGPYAVTWPGVVLLHARPEDGVRRLCMRLTTLRTPVYFGHPENDPVDIALVIGAVDPYSHLRALKELAELLADESAMTMIRQSSDRQEVREIICRFTAR
jgi:mannitol/fructose-specific phosphotransferase system IIA component (Ntr-type)/galactitol-specific phosphotransferase system IIB component